MLIFIILFLFCITDCNATPKVLSSNILYNTRNQQHIAEIEKKLECRVIVAYLGTIEIPTSISSGSELNTVRTSIRKLRHTKKASSVVLMTVLPLSMNLKKNNGIIVAEYSRDRVVYVSSNTESDYRYFGLITCSSHINKNELYPDSCEPEIETSHSCHVFTIDPKLIEHSAHATKANEFQITCTLDPVTNHCLEFPTSCEYIIGVIRSMYSLHVPNGFSSPGVENLSKLAIKNSPVVGVNLSRNNNRLAPLRGVRYGRRVNGCGHDQQIDFPVNQLDNFRHDIHDFANSPQPSNHSEFTTTSSNSDSGIGFHNECQNIADRILIVDFGHQGRHLVNGQALLQNHYESQACRNEIKPRPQGIVGSNYDMDSSFLSNTMPVVDGFGGRGQPLNHLDDVILGGCEVQQPHCSFNANYSNSAVKAGDSKANEQDTYNYNGVHYGNIPTSSKEILSKECKHHCYENLKDICSHYDPVYTENEGHLYEIIKPHLNMDSCLDLDNINEKFNAIDIYQEGPRKGILITEKTGPVVQDYSKKYNDAESIDNITIISSKSHDNFYSDKTSMDDVSVYSSRSQEYFNGNANQIKKLQSSVDDILMLSLTSDKCDRNEQNNFVHPGDVKIKIRKSKKPMNLLSKTRTIFYGKDGKKVVKSTEKRTRALSASVDDICGTQTNVNNNGAFPTACSEPDLRDSSSHHSEVSEYYFSFSACF